MYLDYIKDNYFEKNIEEREKFIDRDKKHLGSIIQHRISGDIEKIVERWYELDDIGYIEDDQEFLTLLKEAEELYSFGYFMGSISLIGVAAEELSKHLANKNNLENKNITQYDRIEKLYKEKIIGKKQLSELHKIRIIRNTYIHFNEKNDYLNKEKIKDQTYSVIRSFKLILSNTLKISKDLDLNLFDKLVSNQNISFEEFKYKNRNMDKKLRGVDLQISPGKNHSTVTSYYYIDEIDISGNDFKELTLVDLANYFPVIVDLTLSQSEQLNVLKLKEGNVILASLVSSVSSIGQTEEWLLLNIHDIYRGEYKLT